MSSAETVLPNQENGESVATCQTEEPRRDVGKFVETTSAPIERDAGRTRQSQESSDQAQSDWESVEQAGCLETSPDKQQSKAAGEGFLSVNAQGGPSDGSQIASQTPRDGIASRRDFEKFLRNSGFSRSEAKAIAARGWHEEAEEPETEALKDIVSSLILELKR